MQIHAIFHELLDPHSLKPNPRNRNIHSDEQITRLAKILKYQGFRAPIVVSKRSGYIVKGHGTRLAAIEAGYQSAPVAFQDFDDEEQEYSFLISDNSLSAWSELDLAAVNLDLADIGPIDIELLGIEDFTATPEEKPKKEKKAKLCPSCGAEV